MNNSYFNHWDISFLALMHRLPHLIQKDRASDLSWMVDKLDHNNTVPIRRNLTGNTWQKVFCCRSTRIPLPFLYPFSIRSVPVPYPFSIRSVLFSFCQCSICKRSWNSFRGTRFLRTRLHQFFQGISNTRLKLVCLQEFNYKLTFSCSKCKSSYRIYPCIMRTFFPLKKVRKLRCVLYTESFDLDLRPSLACKQIHKMCPYTIICFELKS